MATRSRIGLELPDGSILSAYHHWDSYPEWLGRILNTHYNTKEKVAELIDGGDMSSCWTEDRFSIDPTHGFKVQEYGPQYYSQRGDNCPPRLDADLCEYLLPDNSEEFAYVFRNGEWVCYNMNQFDNSKLPEIVEIPSAALYV
jgi:hypothetical protein